MPLISNGIKSKTAGKSGLNNRIYQPFYVISKKHVEINTEKVSLSTGPKFHTLSITGPLNIPFFFLRSFLFSLYFDTLL